MPKNIILSFAIDAEMKMALDEYAAQVDRSISDTVRQILKKELLKKRK